MKLSTKSRYAVMALLDMLENGAHQGSPVSLVSIAQRQGLPLAYLEQIFLNLRKKSIVESVRGAQGGYTFLTPPSVLTLLDIVTATDRLVKSPRCKGGKTGCMPNGTQCLSHHLWDAMDDYIIAFFQKITLQAVFDRSISDLVYVLQTTHGQNQLIEGTPLKETEPLNFTQTSKDTHD